MVVHSHGILPSRTGGLRRTIFTLATACAVGATLLGADDIRDLFAPGPTPLQRELRPIYDRIHAKLETGSHDRNLFTNELNAIDEILQRYAQERPEIVAEHRYDLALAHWRVFHEPKQAIALLEQLKRDFPQTSYAKKADLDIDAIPKIEAGIALRKTIEVGKPFPDFDVRDLSGEALSVANYRGKPVLLLGWSVSTAPLMQFNKLIALQKKYAPDTFEVIGLSMGQDERPVRDYLNTNHIAWRQYFDGRGVRNELVLKYNIGLAHYAFVLDRQGRVLAIDPTTIDEVEAALVKALQIR
jgi:Thioredoxin-like